MKTRILALGLLSTSMTLALAACGGGSGRPSADDISGSLQHGKAADTIGASGKLTSAVADCMGKVLHDSKLSDKTLNALVDGDDDYKGSKDDTSELSALTPKMGECVTK